MLQSSAGAAASALPASSAASQVTPDKQGGEHSREASAASSAITPAARVQPAGGAAAAAAAAAATVDHDYRCSEDGKTVRPQVAVLVNELVKAQILRLGHKLPQLAVAENAGGNVRFTLQHARAVLGGTVSEQFPVPSMLWSAASAHQEHIASMQSFMTQLLWYCFGWNHGKNGLHAGAAALLECLRTSEENLYMHEIKSCRSLDGTLAEWGCARAPGMLQWDGSGAGPYSSDTFRVNILIGVEFNMQLTFSAALANLRALGLGDGHLAGALKRAMEDLGGSPGSAGEQKVGVLLSVSQKMREQIAHKARTSAGKRPAEKDKESSFLQLGKRLKQSGKNGKECAGTVSVQPQCMCNKPNASNLDDGDMLMAHGSWRENACGSRILHLQMNTPNDFGAAEAVDHLKVSFFSPRASVCNRARARLCFQHTLKLINS